MNRRSFFRLAAGAAAVHFLPSLESGVLLPTYSFSDVSGFLFLRNELERLDPPLYTRMRGETDDELRRRVMKVPGMGGQDV